MWALDWLCKSLKARNAAKRAVDETMARADAPSEDLLVGKAASYLANVPRAEQRWLNIWLKEACDETPRAKSDRASKANGKDPKPERAAKPESAPRGEFESESKYIAREAGFPVGTRVRDKERGLMGEVLAGETRADGKVRLLVLWGSRRCRSGVRPSA